MIVFFFFTIYVFENYFNYNLITEIKSMQF